MIRALLSLLLPLAAGAQTVRVGTLNLFRPPPIVWTTNSLFIVGDSKSTYPYLWAQMVAQFNARDTNYVVWVSGPTPLAAAGRSVYTTSNVIDAELAARTTNSAESVKIVLLNLGANDVNGTNRVTGVANGDYPNDIYSFDTNAASWKVALGYILDAVHAKYPNAQIYQMRVWRSVESDGAGGMGAGLTYEDKIALINDTLIPEVHATRPWCSLGADERVFLKGSDNGATMTSDGLHPNVAGQDATALAQATVVFP